MQKIVQNNLCLGCGLCKAVYKEDVINEIASNGFIQPKFLKKDIEKERLLKNICPAINIKNDLSFNRVQNIWGRILEVNYAHATDTEIRFKGSSGGVVSAIAIHLLETGTVDGVLQIGSDVTNYKKNSLKISKNRKDVLECASSRYAPAYVLDDIMEILNKNEDNYCFIGKPCDISALKNFLSTDLSYQYRIKLFISIFCAGIPSFNGTEQIITDFSAKLPVSDLKYRGKGWPGNFSFIDKERKKFEMDYNSSWGKILGKYVHFRCKICPDGIGLQADIAIGDSWETKDGYPDFTEKEGQSLVLIRTEKGKSIFSKMVADFKINTNTFPIQKLKDVQPFQYRRRRFTFVRVVALFLKKGVILKFKHTGIYTNWIGIHPKHLLADFIGTLKRIKYD